MEQMLLLLLHAQTPLRLHCNDAIAGEVRLSCFYHYSSDFKIFLNFTRESYFNPINKLNYVAHSVFLFIFVPLLPSRLPFSQLLSPFLDSFETATAAAAAPQQPTPAATALRIRIFQLPDYNY
jgi:hypothetical protein